MSSYESIADLAQHLNALGCAPAEVERVEESYGQPLPSEYRTFLETMGRDVGGLFRGSDIEYPRMLDMREYAVNLLAENEVRSSLPEDALTFMMHQGYMLWFLTPDDPRVFGWSEGLDDEHKQDFNVEAESLLDYLLDDLNSTVLPRRQMDSHRKSTQTSRRLRLQGESCPHCSTTFRQWSMDSAWGPGELNPGRDRMVGTCEQCGGTYWRWPDSPNAPLQQLRRTGARPKAAWWRRR